MMFRRSIGAALLAPSVAMAGTDVFGVSVPIQSIIDALIVIAGILVVGAIIVAGLSYAFGEAGGLFRPALRVVVGGFIALTAATISQQLFGAGAGFIL